MSNGHDYAKGPNSRVTTSFRTKVDRDVVLRWAIEAAKAADDKLASEPVVLELTELLTITDAFVIASAGNDRQVRAIAEEVERRVKETGGPAPVRIEGLDEGRWVLMDYNDFVVHVFLEDVREFYDLERLWADAPRVEWQGTEAAS